MISKPLWEIYPKYIVVDRLYANNFSLHQGWFLITKKNLWLHVRSGGFLHGYKVFLPLRFADEGLFSER